MIIDNELLAAYAEGNVSSEEREAVRQYLAENQDMMESVFFAMDERHENIGTFGQIDYLEPDDDREDEYIDNLGRMLDDIEDTPGTKVAAAKSSPSLSLYSSSQYLPMTAMAAQNAMDRQCAIRCEGMAMRHFGIQVSDDELLQLSEKEGWLQSEGTALHNIGRLSGMYGLSVTHRYHCNIKDIQDELSAGNVIIAAIDGNELTGNYQTEQLKDCLCGLTPNHVVIVNSLDNEGVTLTDSATPNKEDHYPLAQFLDAWNDSSNNLVIISDSTEYIPHPINLDDVEVEEELLELREAIAENAHEVWAETRRNEGWTYGEVRDDTLKHHPDMIPYSRLPESEKEYDRLIAMNTIKLVKKLGWELKKKDLQF